MAAAIKALNAKIRSNPVTDYFCSTRTSHLIHGHWRHERVLEERVA